MENDDDIAAGDGPAPNSPEMADPAADEAFDGLLEIFETTDSSAKIPTIKSPPETPATPTGDSPVARQFLPGTVIAQRYRIVSLVGRGGMGEVYQAEDLTLGEMVALKFLPPDFGQDPLRLKALYNEVRIGRRVTHPNVCRFHDVAEIDGRHFLSMEFIDGEHLGHLLRRIGQLPRDKAIQLARQLCAGLAAAHEQGVLHLDLKPANLMVDGKGNLRITDFGLARVAGDGDGDGDGTITGTPPYMAPEQLRSGVSSEQSDIYAMGLIISEMLTGQPVQRLDSDIKEISQQHDSKSSAQLAAGVLSMNEPEISDVVIASLEKDPTKRPRSVTEVAARLPGGPDALTQALAAGETPTPELVAAAGESGTLGRRSGLALLLAIALAFAAIALLNHRSLHSDTSKKFLPWAALASKADEALRSEHPRQNYNKSGYAWDKDTERYFFWYRESPKALFPEKGMNRRVSQNDPPPDEPGMYSIALSTSGAVIPPDISPDPGSQSSYDGRDSDWVSTNKREHWLWLTVTVASVFLCIHNLRHGKADRRGGLIVALIIGSFALIHRTLCIGPSLVENRPDVFFHALQCAFSDMAAVAVFYLAMEPIMRRLWPETLIAWSRLLAGNWRNPLVGQSILVGILAGSLNVLVVNLGIWAFPDQLSPDTARLTQWYAQGNEFEPLWSIAFSSGQQAMLYAFGIGVSLVLFAAMISKKRRLACTLATAFLALFQVGVSEGLLPILIVGISTALLLAVLVRIGVLSLLIAMWSALILQPLALLSISYQFASLRIAAVFLLVALFGFFLSTKSRRAAGDQRASRQARLPAA